MLLGGKSYAFAEYQQIFVTLTDFTLERERYCLPDRVCCFSCLVVLLFSCWMSILLEVTTNNQTTKQLNNQITKHHYCTK